LVPERRFVCFWHWNLGGKVERINRDVVVAAILLLFCGVFFWASFEIRQPDYGVLMPSTWPRVILGILTFLSMLYLIQSLREGADETGEEDDFQPKSIGEWYTHWRNVIWCFSLFFGYLMVLPILGMLLSGILFVFVLLGVMGGWAPRNLVMHAAVAVLAIGTVWSLFTFALGVLLPPGMIIPVF